MFRQEIHGLSCLFQIMDFRPLFIAPALRRLDTVLNVDKQGHACFPLWSFSGSGTPALYPFPYGFLCIVCTEGFQAGKPFLPRSAAGNVFPRFYLIARRLQPGKQFFKTGYLRDKRVHSGFQLAFPTGSGFFRDIFRIALSLAAFLRGDNGQAVFPAQPVTYVPYAVIAAFIGIVLVVVYKIDRAENDVVE